MVKEKKSIRRVQERRYGMSGSIPPFLYIVRNKSFRTVYTKVVNGVCLN